MAFPEDALRIPLGPRQVEMLAAAMPYRLPPEREVALGKDPVAADNYSKVMFDGGQLPEVMHKQMFLNSFKNPCSQAVNDYFGRLR